MRRSLVCVAATFVLLSCEDKEGAATQPPTAPPAPAAVVVAKDSYLMLSQVKALQAKSRVCFGYLKQRTKLLAQLKNAPTDTTLIRKADHLAAMLTDACN